MTNPMTETGEKGLMEIPEDVIKAATELQDMVDRDPKAYLAFDVAVLATLLERERCAQIAEERFTIDSVLKTTKGEPYITGSAAIYAATIIAGAIRNRSAGQ